MRQFKCTCLNRLMAIIPRTVASLTSAVPACKVVKYILYMREWVCVHVHCLEGIFKT